MHKLSKTLVIIVKNYTKQCCNMKDNRENAHIIFSFKLKNKF